MISSRPFKAPKAFAIGALSQVVLLPVVALTIVITFGLTAEIAVGLMLLSFCPGGDTSNMLARFARGDVALSVSLTGVISLLSILTELALSAWAITHFLGDTVPEISVAGIATKMFLITTLPVVTGMLIRHFTLDLATRMEPLIARIAATLF